MAFLPGGTGGVTVVSTEESINDQSGIEVSLFFKDPEGEIMESRVLISATLAETILGLSIPASVVLSTYEIGPGMLRL